VLRFLGLNACHGDTSGCLIEDGGVVTAAEAERFRRVKHWSSSLATPFAPVWRIGRAELLSCGDDVPAGDRHPEVRCAAAFWPMICPSCEEPKLREGRSISAGDAFWLYPARSFR
jgi:hypothetical protein